jgi:hypothetical protein
MYCGYFYYGSSTAQQLFRQTGVVPADCAVSARCCTLLLLLLLLQGDPTIAVALALKSIVVPGQCWFSGILLTVRFLHAAAAAAAAAAG